MVVDLLPRFIDGYPLSIDYSVLPRFLVGYHFRYTFLKEHNTLSRDIYVYFLYRAFPSIGQKVAGTRMSHKLVASLWKDFPGISGILEREELCGFAGSSIEPSMLPLFPRGNRAGTDRYQGYRKRPFPSLCNY